MIKEYWNLIDQETFLAITWEPDFSQAYSFRRMLMNHKNFHFLTQISDKTNNVISLKSPKTMFLGHFWPFLPDRDFFQKLRLCYTQLYMGPYHHAKLQEKLMSQPRENLRADGRTERRRDRRTDRPYFIGPFWPRPGV